MGRIVSIHSQTGKGVKANIILKPEQHGDLIAKLHKKLGRPITASEIRGILYGYVQDVVISGDKPIITQPSHSLDKVKETANAPTPEIEPTQVNNGLHEVENSSYELDNELQQQVDNVLYDTLGLEQGEQDDTFWISDDDF